MNSAALPRFASWPMSITILRLALLPGVFWLLILLNQSPGFRSNRLRWMLVGLITFLSLTDILDGYLARRLHQITPLGTLLDPIADKLLLSGSLLLLCLARHPLAGFAIPWPVVLGVYLKDFGVILGILVVFHQLGDVKIAARSSGKIDTLIQAALILATLLAPDFARFRPAFAAVLIWSLWWGTVWFTALAAWDYSCQGAMQLRSARL